MTTKRKKKSAPKPDNALPAEIRNRIKRHVRMRAGDLVPHEQNFRRHPDGQRAALQGLYEEVGFARSLLAYELPDGRLKLLDGHLRQEMNPNMEVDVEVLDVTDDEAKLLLASMDPLAEMAQADAEALDKLLKDVKTDNEALGTMLRSLADAHPWANGNAGIGDADAVPEPPDEAITQPGDLWILGNHRLLCGDSCKAEDVDRLLDGAPIHLVSTDPPYNVRVEPRSNNAIAAGKSSFPADAHPHYHGFDVARDAQKGTPTHAKLRAKDRPLVNDFVSDEEYDRLLDAWFGTMARVLLPGHSFFCWAGYANLGNYPPFLKKHGLYFSQGIVWDKEHPVLTRKDFMGAFEICFHGWREGAAHRFFGPNNATDLWHVKKVNPQSMVHLTQKPCELAARAIEYSSRPGENVLDLFGGSGSTLIAAEQMGRKAFLMEIDQLYCDVIVKRWEDFTGKKAERQPKK